MSSISSGTTTTTGYVVSSDTTGALVLKTGSAATTAVTIDTSQNVGIGTGSPSQALDVSGNINVSGTGTSSFTSTATSPVQINGTSIPTLTIRNSTTSVETQIRSTTTEGLIRTATDHPLVFATNASERMRLDTSGNLGLGVTPSAWKSTYKAIQFSSSSAVYGETGNTYVGSNVFVNSSDSNTYITTNFASMYRQVDGKHLWYTAASGSAGASITFTNPMTLTATGRLGIGTTAPATTLDSRGDACLGTNLYLGADTVFQEQRITVVGSTSGSTGLSFSGYTGATYTERARIDSSGNLLVGTSSNNGRLCVQGSTANSSANALYVTSSSGSQMFLVRNDGALRSESTYYITTASAGNLNIDTSGYIARSTSSLKYKNNVQDATHGLAKVLALRPVTYKGNNNGDTVFGGLIAEEVHEAGLTEFVQYAEDGSPDALAYGNMVSLAFKAIQEQQALIQQLQADVAILKGVQQ